MKDLSLEGRSIYVWFSCNSFYPYTCPEGTCKQNPKYNAVDTYTSCRLVEAAILSGIEPVNWLFDKSL